VKVLELVPVHVTFWTPELETMAKWATFVNEEADTALMVD